MTVFYLLMTNSNLSSCSSLSLVSQKQCYWTHLTLGNPLIFAACYAIFTITYLLCVWKVYRDHPHTKQDLSVCFKQLIVLQATDRKRADTREPFAETRFWTFYSITFSMSIPTNRAEFSNKKHTLSRSHRLVATVFAHNPLERLPQCTEAANCRHTTANRPPPPQILLTSKENDPYRAAILTPLSKSYRYALALHDVPLSVRVDNIFRGLRVFPEQLERCAALFDLSKSTECEERAREIL